MLTLQQFSTLTAHENIWVFKLFRFLGSAQTNWIIILGRVLGWHLHLKLSPSDFDVQWGLRTSALARSRVGFDGENPVEPRKLFTWCPTAPSPPPWGQSQCELNVNWTHWEDQGTIKKQISQWHIHGTFCKGINKLPSGPAIVPLAFKSL